MPVLINEVIAELEPIVGPGSQAAPQEQQLPLSQAELDLLELLALIEQRRQRLSVD